MRPKKPQSRTQRSFLRPGRNSLSCTTPCLRPRALASCTTATASARSVGGRLFAIDVLAGVDRPGQQRRRAPAWCAASKNTSSSRVGERRVEIGGPARDAVRVSRAPRPCPRCGRPGSDRASRGRRLESSTPPCVADRDDASGSDAGSVPMRPVTPFMITPRRCVVIVIAPLGFFLLVVVGGPSSPTTPDARMMAKPGDVSDPVNRSPSWMASRMPLPSRT